MKEENVWQGQLVRLRAVEPEDWKFFFEWNADSEFARYTYHLDFPSSREGIKKWTAELAVAEPQDHAFRWVIENLAGQPVGTLNTHTCDPRMGTFQYGVAIRREHWRQGYGAEAVRLVLTYFFRELRYQKVNVHIYVFNDASLQLHRRLGFREEGRLRRMIYTDGVFHDLLVLGMTVEEFEASETLSNGNS